MQPPFGKFLMFRNRLEKVYRHLSKQARRQNISCYRVYDHDIPEFPLLVELYEEKIYVAEYKRHHQLSEQEHDDWWAQSRAVITAVTGIAESNIHLKLRKRKESRLGQYQKHDERGEEIVVMEGGLKFLVNLDDYLDTGLFLDHRTTRGMVRAEAKGKRVLNLFCYTGSFSVYALSGGADSVQSVDLSKTYLAWTERNVAQNFTGDVVHTTVHADAIQYLKGLQPASYDLIVMDPPTFSNSKRMDDILDIQRDHVSLINDCLNSLAPGGRLYFSTNYRKFQLDAGALTSTSIKDITKQTTPFDFEGKLNRQCFLVGKEFN
jgi:23S rRNA (cytosine1962-C5)-methyltransferase